MPGTGPGKGRYTTFVPPKSARRSFLEKLFKGSETLSSPYLDLDQGQAAELASKVGNDKLRAIDSNGIQEGDPGMFPQGVDMKFTGDVAELQVPNTLENKDNAWTEAGDPANSYVPDITSPGPGKTLGTDKNVDPQITSADVKPDYVPGSPDSGTVSPHQGAGQVYAANQLGKELTKGKST